MLTKMSLNTRQTYFIMRGKFYVRFLLDGTSIADIDWLVHYSAWATSTPELFKTKYTKDISVD